MIRLLLFLTFCIAFWPNPVARAEDDALYMIGLEVHPSRSVTPAEAEKISRYLFHNIAKWSPGAAMVVYEGDTRGGGSKVDPIVNLASKGSAIWPLNFCWYQSYSYWPNEIKIPPPNGSVRPWVASANGTPLAINHCTFAAPPSN
jgi:hypothetical protein